MKGGVEWNAVTPTGKNVISLIMTYTKALQLLGRVCRSRATQHCHVTQPTHLHRRGSPAQSMNHDGRHLHSNAAMAQERVRGRRTTTPSRGRGSAELLWRISRGVRHARAASAASSVESAYVGLGVESVAAETADALRLAASGYPHALAPLAAEVD
jgi:hypothetical protein